MIVNDRARQKPGPEEWLAVEVVICKWQSLALPCLALPCLGRPQILKDKAYCVLIGFTAFLLLLYLCCLC